MRRAGRSKHRLRVLSIAGACRYGRRAVPSPAISPGWCARAPTELLRPRARRASCWSRRAFPFAVGLRRAPPADGVPVRHAACSSRCPSRWLCTRVYVQTRARGAGRDDRRDDHSRPKLRRTLRRSHRTRNRHLSHTPAISPASAPHAHTGRPLRHPVNLRPTLITSCQRPLAFRKVRSDKNAASPDTIGSGKHRVSFQAAPPLSSGTGLPGFIRLSCMALSG